MHTICAYVDPFKNIHAYTHTQAPTQPHATYTYASSRALAHTHAHTLYAGATLHADRRWIPHLPADPSLKTHNDLLDLSGGRRLNSPVGPTWPISESYARFFNCCSSSNTALLSSFPRPHAPPPRDCAPALTQLAQSKQGQKTLAPSVQSPSLTVRGRACRSSLCCPRCHPIKARWVGR